MRVANKAFVLRLVATGLACCLMVSGPIVTHAQDAEGDDADRQKALRSLNDERRDILLYGIDSQVLEVIDDLKNERDAALLDDLLAVFKLTSNNKIRVAALGLFQSLDYQEARGDALLFVESYGTVPNDLVSAAIRYLSDAPEESAASSPVSAAEVEEALVPILSFPDESLAREAINAIGKVGDAKGSSSVSRLLELLDSVTYSASLKPQIILALGNLRAEQAVDMLIDIVTNTNEDPTWRRYACDSLGKIGDRRAIPAIQEAYGSEDAILRSYAVAAMGYFDTPDSTALLIEALRDSYWRTRVGAARALGEREVEAAVPALSFKASRDPENNVRVEAVRALARIGAPEGVDLLIELYGADSTPAAVRLTAAEELINRAPQRSLETVTSVVEREWDRRGSRLLERTAYFLSLSENPAFAGLYQRFLQSGDAPVIIHGIRGIQRSGLTDQVPALDGLAAEGNHTSVRRAALAALEAFEE